MGSDVEQSCINEAGNATGDLEKVGSTATIGASLHEAETDPYGSRPACFKNTFEEILFVLTTTFAIAQSSLLGGVIICITSYVGRDLHMTAGEISWINAAQYLTSGAFLLLFGKIADVFGRRRLLVLSLASFAVCQLVLGFSKNAIFLDVFCGLAGLCCAAAVPPAIGKLGAVYEKPSRRKNWAFACFSAGNPVGFAIGGFLSGVATAVSSWRVAFWAMAVIFAVFTVIAWFTVPEDSEQDTSKFNLETLRSFDLLGAFLAVVGMAMFTAGLTLPGQAPQGWHQNYVLAMIILGFVFIAGFVYWESICQTPLMPLHVWRERNFSILVAILCLGFYGFTGNLFWLSLYWQRIEHKSPLIVAVRLLPAMVGGIIINVIAGMTMHRISNKVLMLVGALGMAAASAILSAMPDHASYWAFAFPALICSVVGVDFEFTVTNMYVMNSLPRAQQSVGGGMFNTATRLTATVGLGIQTGIFQATGTGALDYHGYRATFWVSAAGAGLALLLWPFLTLKVQGAKHKSTNQPQLAGTKKNEKV